MRENCEKGKVSTHWEVPSLAGRTARMEGELRSLRGECSNQFAEGKEERHQHSQSVLPPGTPQPKMLTLPLRGSGAEC